MAIFPHEADHGHAKMSQWNVAAVGAPATGVGMKIRILKGVIPFESEHPDFWRGRAVIPLLNDVTKTGGGQPLDDYPHSTVIWEGFLTSTSPLNYFVPPGTKEVRGTLWWTHAADPAVPHTTWLVKYKGANVPKPSPDTPATFPFSPATMKANGTNRWDFTITPGADEVDQFYQQRSAWRLVVDDGLPPIGTSGKSQNTGYQTVFHLTAAAVKDPDFVD